MLLGTAGGTTVLSDERYGISTAVVYEDKVYIVDLGHGSHPRLLSAGFGGPEIGGTSMAKIRGIFFTHLHSDHVVEWPAVYATAPMNTVGRTIEEPIQVFGPGDRGSLPRVFPPGRPTAPAFAFRFDTPDGSVVVSGDTWVSQNLIDLARDCD